MKKILGISLVAVLAATPLMARAADGDIAPSTYAIVAGETGTAVDSVTNNQPVAAGAPLYTGKTVSTEDAGHVATAAYVKGAYNAALSAVNKVSQTAAADAQSKADAAEAAAIAAAALDATSKANAAQAAAEATAAADATSKANAAQAAAEQTAATALSTALADYTTTTALQTNYATKDGVENTVNAATATGTVVATLEDITPAGSVSSTFKNGSVSASINLPDSVNVVTAWGNDNATTLALNTSNTATAINGTVTGQVDSSFTGTTITSAEARAENVLLNVSVDDYHPTAPANNNG